LTLAAEEVASGEELDTETLPQLMLLLRQLRKAEKRVELRVGELAAEMAGRSRSP
jgi:hypothetical protein